MNASSKPIQSPDTEEDPFDSEEFQEHMHTLSMECRCCPDCWENPCGACMAGAPCDDRLCDCGEDYDS